MVIDDRKPWLLGKKNAREVAAETGTKHKAEGHFLPCKGSKLSTWLQ
jgi:hypothetical protein